ncbi:MAG: hypothetical protein J6J87_01245 [Oscillospiraceae bacterium]|nr:hypothetical protein [Oscillospiraceae bacterium]
MAEKKIRRWAWEKTLEKKWFLFAVILVGSLPGVLVIRIIRNLSWPLRLGVGTPLRILTNILGLGAVFVFLRVAKGEEAKIGQIMTPFSREWFGKALLIVLVYLAVVAILNHTTGFLTDWGTEIIKGSGYVEALNAQTGISWEIRTSYMKGNAIKSLGTGLRSLLGYCVAIVWFPVDYFLFLSPKKNGRQVIREGISLGFHSFWSIFKFRFWVMLPGGIMIFLGISILFLLRETWIVGLVGIPLFYLFNLFLAYVMVAEAGFALTLTGGTIKTAAKKKRK